MTRPAYTHREVWYAGVLEFLAKYLGMDWAMALAVICGAALVVGYWRG